MAVPKVIPESFYTTPEFAPLREALTARSWPALERAVAALPSDQVGTALTQLGDVRNVEDFLEAAVASAPTSPLARTALATRYISLAWEARSRDHAENVSSDQFVGFFEWLSRAEALLTEVNDEQPDFAPAWAAGLYTVRGLQLGQLELRRRYSALSALTPHDYPAQVQALQLLLPKWSGSWESATDFVRAESADAPVGSNTHALTALLHIERWIELDNTPARESHLRDARTLAELTEASARFVGNGNQTLDPVRVQAHNAFFMVLWLGDYNDAAAEHVQALGGRISEFPWRYVSPSVKTLSDIQRRMLGEKNRWFRR